MSEEAQEQKSKPSWQFPVTSDVFFDPLLDSLEILTRLHGRPHSKESLTAGMPLVNNKFTFDVFIRAAKRAGLSSRLLKRPLGDISHLSTPCVLVLTEQRACVLTAIDHEKGEATVIFPDSGDGALTLPVSELGDYYDNHILLAKPTFRFEARAEKTVALDSEHWFWGTLMMSWRIYRDVLIASVLINMFALVTPLFTRNVYDRVVPNSAIDTMWALAIGALLVFTFDIVMKMTRTYFLDLAGKKADLLLSAKIFARVLGMRFEGRPASVGTFSKNVQEFEVVRDFITSATMAALVDLPFVMIFLTVIWILSGNLVWIPVAAIIIILLSGLIFHPLMKEATEKSSRASSQKNGLLIEAIGGLES
ncbi:MAG: type I secretion system permease/ATPase, partial [Desulfobacterales bacterium]|nr:type I secretion system permease/ATPase [Desulfobacterales bacterium]